MAPWCRSTADWKAAGGAADWIMLGMKPQQLGEVAAADFHLDADRIVKDLELV